MRARLVILAFVVAGPALAQPADAPRRAPFTPGPPVTLPDCTCRADGRDWRVGEQVCLRTGTGERIATCAMDQNVTTWRVSDVPCASSRRPESRLFALIHGKDP